MKNIFKKMFIEFIEVQQASWKIWKAGFAIFQVFASKITRDKNYHSRKNKFTAYFLIFSIIITFFIYEVLYPYYNSGWASLERHYKYEKQVEYQKSDYMLNLVTLGHEDNLHVYYVKLMLKNSGFFFSSPSGYYGDYRRSSSAFFHKPLFIPWDAIQECQKIEVDYEDDKIRMPIENTEVSIQLTLWDFLSPICVQKGIPLIE